MKILCLGDSYTIGEGVPFNQNFPHQLTTLLQQKQISVHELTIVATTGWTTDELIASMENIVKKNEYDLVTILIGVNNQYRGRSAQEYEIHFKYILNRAIYYAKNNAANVIVLSIPDWGVTPFNVDRNAVEIANEIDAFNKINESSAKKCNAKYLNITNSTRINGTNPEYLAIDGLHPSSKEYEIWANEIFKIIL